MGQPECYGKLWESNAAECAGGYDSAYVSTSGTKVRPKCDYFDSCKTRVMLTRSNQQQQQLLAPSALIRPSVPVLPQSPQPLYVPGRQGLTYAPQPQQPQVYGSQYPMVVTQPVQMVPANYGIPAFLTTPEVRRPNESIMAPLGREVVRSIGKAFGHSIAHFFDITAFSSHEED